MSRRAERPPIPDHVRTFHTTYKYLRDVSRFDRLVQLADPSPDSICLDVGCGSGAYSTLKMAEHVREVIGIDIDPRSVRDARKELARWRQSAARKAGAIRRKVSLRVMNAEAMDFEDAAFDIVVSRGGLRQCENWDKAFAECLRVLKPGGKMLLIEVVLPRDLIDLWNAIDFAQGRCEHYWEYPQLVSRVQTSSVEILFILPDRAERNLEEYLRPIEDEKIRRTLRRRVSALSEAHKKALGMTTVGRNKNQEIVFYYPVVSLVLHKRPPK